MNREKAQKILPILQAFAEGKEIQCKKSSGWINLMLIDFSMLEREPEKYRVKPEPIRIKVIVEKATNSAVDIADFHTIKNGVNENYEVRNFIEVIE